MKKILSFVISFMLIFSCFAVTVFAEDMAIEGIETPTSQFEENTVKDFDVFNSKMPKGSFSDRYENFYADGEQYTRINAKIVEMDLDYYWIVEDKYNDDYYLGTSIYIELSNQQKQEIKTVNLKSNKDRTIVEATLTYYDDAEMQIVYLKDDYLNEYNNIVSGNTDTLTVDFSYPYDNKVVAQRNQLVGETVTFTRNQLAKWNIDFDVIAQNSDGSISVVAGKILVINEEFYYINFNETGLTENDLYNHIGEFANKPVHKIADADLIEELNNAMVDYYEDDYGVLYDDNATESISIVFFVFVFAVIPLAILVFFLIKVIKGKGIYKKLYFAVVAICLAEIVVFSILAGIVIKTSSLDDFDFSLTGKTIEEYAEDMGVGTHGEDVEMLKEAVYCGDGDCRDGCTTGYFYRDKNFSEEDAMLGLELGEKTENTNEWIDSDFVYIASWSQNIIVNSTEFANGYIVEYQVIGVG
ncbi:MAG: hypothetical protein IKU41_02655 [Clostridia bacterium]|nr:hypothetical protein [Clostridia bacterium]